MLWVTYRREVSHCAVPEEADRLRLLERILAEVAAATHHYHSAAVLARYAAALLPHLADADTARRLAETDLQTWEQRHEYHVPARHEDFQHANLSALFLRVEGGWRVYPVAAAHADDLRSHVREYLTQHIAALEAALSSIGPSLADAVTDGLDALMAEGEALRADWEEELATARQLLLAPPWCVDAGSFKD